jgi:hypothetical protein
MEGGEKHPMKDLEDLYMQNVFPRNYNLKNTVNPEINDDLVEKEMIKLRNNLLKSYHLLKTFNVDPKFKGIIKIIRKELVDRVFHKFNISLRKETSSEDFSKTPFIIKVRDIQGLFNSIDLSLEKLINYYNSVGNESAAKQIAKTKEGFNMPALLFDRYLFLPYRKYMS